MLFRSVRASPRGDLGKTFVDANILLDDKGNPESTTISLGKNSYFDLDGDGVIDALYDKQGQDGVPKVIFEGRFVQVEDFKTGFDAAKGQKPTMWGLGRKVQYVFDKGVWNQK